jgi:hypothetical protein
MILLFQSTCSSQARSAATSEMSCVLAELFTNGAKISGSFRSRNYPNWTKPLRGTSSRHVRYSTAQRFAFLTNFSKFLGVAPKASTCLDFQCFQCTAIPLLTTTGWGALHQNSNNWEKGKDPKNMQSPDYSRFMPARARVHNRRSDSTL